MYNKLVASKIKNTEINFKSFENNIGFVRQSGVMSHEKTQQVRKYFKKISFETDISPSHAITCAILKTLCNNTPPYAKDNKQILLDICSITNTRPVYVKRLLQKYSCLLQ
jgi:hypothetical protein